VQRIILFPFSTWAVLEQLSLCFPYIKVFTKPTLKTNKAPNENKLKTKTKHHRDYLSLVNKSSSYNQGEHKLKEILQKRRKSYCNNFNIQTS